MTISLVGVCKQGKIPKAGQWTDPNGHVFHGIAYVPCEECGGKGCTQSGDAALAAATDRLTDGQKRELAEVVERIVGSGT